LFTVPYGRFTIRRQASSAAGGAAVEAGRRARLGM
jgi:hypothetical protein